MRKRFEGRNLDEALRNAAKALGVERYQLTYHVVLEKRGFLGGMKRVVIEADVNASAPAPAPIDEDEMQPPSLASSDLSFPARERRGSRRRHGRRGGKSDRGRLQPAHRRTTTPIENVPPQGPESDQAVGIRGWCEELFELAHLDLELRTEEGEEQIQVRLYGHDAKLVVSHGGELLDSLQVIVNKAVVGRGVEKRVELECREFKQRRINELARRAREVAEQVRRDGREQMLEAMSPVERRIVHLALQDDGEVATESRGEGFYKRVAIVPRKQGESSPVHE